MYSITSKSGVTLCDSASLDEAMTFAKATGMFVTIKGPEFEVCGVFGVDQVTDPDYDGWISRKNSFSG